MIFDSVIKNLIYDPVSVVGLLVFYLLLINLPLSLIAVFTKKSFSIVRLLTDINKFPNSSSTNF